MTETRVDSALFVSLLADFAGNIVASRAPNEVIERGTPYMERWMLGRKMTVPTFVGRSRTNVGALADPTPMPTEVENVFLHRYLRNDPEDMHCHPWPNASVVLRGWYIEDTPEGRFTRRPGDVVLRPANGRHAIIEIDPGTLSLFVTGPKEREWGFYPEGEFVHHTEYTAWRRRMGLLEAQDG